MDSEGKKNNLSSKAARERVYHASRLVKYRNPFGAQPEGSEVRLCLDCPSSYKEVTLCYTYGLYSFSYHEEPMSKLSDTYKVDLMLPDESGLLFYWFRFVDDEDNVKYYVAGQ